MTELTTAHQREDAGDIDGAIAAYRAAQQKCGSLKPQRRARAACAEALLGEAEALEHAQRTDEAIATYLAIPSKAPDDTATASIATLRAGEMLLRAGRTIDAWTALWKCVTDWPDEASAGDALRAIVEDGRRRDARALADQIGTLLTSLAETQVADNLLWALADLTEHELGNAEAARAFYDRIPVDYPKSGMRDDARWHGARISRAIGDPQGAVTRLRGLLATREVAFGAGSYFSIWLDDAQLELGKVLRDDLGDFKGASAAFERLPKDYPASILKDDALWELAVTHAKARDVGKACETVRKLATQSPDSKYLARKGELGCE
ncbi:MAG: tetratricopeptide repeat protein [Kofleriaceae bacterium]